MNFKTLATGIYGLLVGIGGVIGYIKAGSLPSLIMGGSSAFIILGCAFAMYRQSVLAHFSAVFIASMLTCFFAYRFFASYAFMPSGMMLVMSIALLTILCARQKKTALNN